MAIGAMQALQTHGVHVPEDVIVAGFDDIEETRAITPSLRPFEPHGAYWAVKALTWF